MDTIIVNNKLLDDVPYLYKLYPKLTSHEKKVL